MLDPKRGLAGITAGKLAQVPISVKVTGSAGKLPLVPGKVTIRSQRSDSTPTASVTMEDSSVVDGQSGVNEAKRFWSKLAASSGIALPEAVCDAGVIDGLLNG